MDPAPLNTWTMQEELALVRAWIVGVEEEFPEGPPQVRRGSFWSRVCYLFHHEMGRTKYRRRRDVNSKFVDLKQKVKDFQRIYNEMGNEHPNMDEDILLEVSKELYRLESNGSEFTHIEAWNILKNVPHF